MYSINISPERFHRSLTDSGLFMRKADSDECLQRARADCPDSTAQYITKAYELAEQRFRAIQTARRAYAAERWNGHERRSRPLEDVLS